MGSDRFRMLDVTTYQCVVCRAEIVVTATDGPPAECAACDEIVRRPTADLMPSPPDPRESQTKVGGDDLTLLREWVATPGATGLFFAWCWRRDFSQADALEFFCRVSGSSFELAWRTMLEGRMGCDPEDGASMPPPR